MDPILNFVRDGPSFLLVRVLLNAESTSRVQSFPQSLIPVLSAMRAGVIPRYPVTHVHSCYPNCPGGKDIIFIPGHFKPFFCNIIELCLRNMIPREPGTWLSPGMVSISVLSEEIEHFKL